MYDDETDDSKRVNSDIDKTKKAWIIDIKHSLYKTPTSSPGNLGKVT